MASLVKSPKGRGKKACVFCGEAAVDEDMFGKLLTKAGVTAHYFCMLFSSGLSQNGKSEKEGILGFLSSDVFKEVRRASRLRCSFCKKNGATIGCVMKNCKKSFHLGCGRRNDTLHQFFDTFCSYCAAHRPQQTVTASDDPCSTCSICMNHVNSSPSVETLQAPCCKKNWYHRKCIQRYSNSAGLYFFKCPLCNNKEDFQHTMLTFGIYIPDQDAAWETEPNAYQELLERYRNCDAAVCKCAEGRQYDKEGSKWELILCESCGSQGSHVACNFLLKFKKKDVCPSCYTVDRTFEKEKKMKSPERMRSPQMPLLEPEGQKQNESLYPGPSNKLKKKGLPSQNHTSPGIPSMPVLSPQERTNMSPRMKMTPKSKLVGDEKGKGKRLSKASPGSKKTTSNQFKLKCETQTYEMFKSEKSRSGESKEHNKHKAVDKKKIRSEINVKSSNQCEAAYSGGLEKIGTKSTTSEKRKYNKRKSVENDSSQTSIMNWLKVEPQSEEKASSYQKNGTKSPVKCSRRYSTAFEKVGSKLLSMSDQTEVSKGNTKRPRTFEWKGKQLIIKSPKVLLRKDSRLGKLKPRNLTIDMNDRKGESECDQDFLTQLDTSMRVTRNMVQTDLSQVANSGRDLNTEDSNQKTSKFLKTETDVKVNVRKAGNSPQKLVKSNTVKETRADSTEKKLRLGRVTRLSLSGKHVTFERSDNDDRLAEIYETRLSNNKKYVEETVSINKMNKNDKQKENLEKARSENFSGSPFKDLRKRREPSICTNGVLVPVNDNAIDNVQTENTKKSVQFGNIESTPNKANQINSSDDKLKAFDSPAKNLRKHKIALSLDGLAEHKEDILQLKGSNSVPNSPKKMYSFPNLIDHQGICDSPAKNLRKHAHTQLTDNKENEIIDTHLKDGEHTPTDQILPFNLSLDLAEKMLSLESSHKIVEPSSCKELEVSESCSSKLSEPRHTIVNKPQSSQVSVASRCDAVSSEKNEPPVQPEFFVKSCASSLAVSQSVRSSPRLKSKEVDIQESECDSARHPASSTNTATKACQSDELFLDENMNVSPLRKVQCGLKVEDSDSPIFRSVHDRPANGLCKAELQKETVGKLPAPVNENTEESQQKVSRQTRMTDKTRHSLSSSVMKDDMKVQNGKKLEDFKHDLVWKAKQIKMQCKSEKILRQRKRNSLPTSTLPNGQTVCWTLSGTRQIVGKTNVYEKVGHFFENSKQSQQSHDVLLKSPEQNDTNDFVKTRQSGSLPLKKRKCITAKLDANSDIRDFIGKSNSVFHSEPLTLSRANSECSDISTTSDVCTTGLSLSPSYITRFRRSHSRVDTDIPPCTAQNSLTFIAENKDKMSNSKADCDQKNLPCDSDIMAMTSYYSDTPSKKRKRPESGNSDDSDVIILPPLQEGTVVID